MSDPREVSHRLLVIDDDVGMRSFMQRGLSLAGYIVDVAANGEAGIESAAQCMPDLILMDLMMPGIGGFATLAHFQALGARPKLIVVSGRDNLEDRMRAATADCFLVKPVGFDTLLQTIRSVLNEPISTLDEPFSAPLEQP